MARNEYLSLFNEQALKITELIRQESHDREVAVNYLEKKIRSGKTTESLGGEPKCNDIATQASNGVVSQTSDSFWICCLSHLVADYIFID